MIKTFKKQKTNSEIHPDFQDLKAQILSGTAPSSVIKRFQYFLESSNDMDPLLGYWEAIEKERILKGQKSLRARTVGIGFSCFILGIGFLFVGIRKLFNPPLPLTKVANHIPQTKILVIKKQSSPIIAPKPIVVIPHLLPDQINFCGEVVPMDDHKISKKMRVAFYQARYSHIQSSKLKEKVRRWFPIITPILKKYHIPDDFKYIPIVETGFANSVSGKGAAGFWQLMEGTARQYGLKVNDSTDERLNVQKSTVAACRYLRDMHKQLGSWTLTAAAYNMGAGGLQNKVEDQNMRDYYHLKLNAETSKYIYRTIAFKQMLNPRKKKV
jgi:membrane-bound lytic murein transglycosylase D